MDGRRFVTINPFTGAVTALLDAEDGTNYAGVRDSWKLTPGKRTPQIGNIPRRYGGGRVATETHENAQVEWKTLMFGASVDAAFANAEALLAVLERAHVTYLEWTPDGASDPTYYEIAGPGSYEIDYKPVQSAGGAGFVVSFTFPLLPLGQGALATQTISSMTAPGVVQLSAIDGNAPALADVALRSSGGSAPVWGLLAWTKRPGTPLSSSVAPFGIIEAESLSGLSTWSAIGTDTNYRGSNGVRATTSGAGSASGYAVIDPSVMEADPFTQTIDLEVWARIELDGDVVSPKLTLSVEPNEGTSYGAPIYTAEYGSTGKLLVRPGGTSAYFRLVRLGIVTVPVDPDQPLKWNLKVAAAWAGGSSGVFGLDYLAVVPARSRCLCRSGVANDSSFPAFIPSASDTTRLVRSDLSGGLAKTTGNFGPAAGMGGSPIELPPGDVDLLVLPSSVVPDDPTSDTSSMAKQHASVTGTVYVRPRYWLAAA